MNVDVRFTDRLVACLEERTHNLDALIGAVCGVQLLLGVLDASCVLVTERLPEFRRRRRKVKILRSVTQDASVRSAVFLGHALPLFYLNVSDQAPVRERFDLLLDVLHIDFSLDAEDQRVLSWLDRLTPESLHGTTQGVLSFHALTVLIGKQKAKNLPAFRDMPDDWSKWFVVADWKWGIFTDIYLPSCWNGSAEYLLDLLTGERPEQVARLRQLLEDR